MVQHAQDIGLCPRAQMGPRAWKRTAHGAVHGARSTRLKTPAQAAELQHEHGLPGDAAYMGSTSVTPEGQVGALG